MSAAWFKTHRRTDRDAGHYERKTEGGAWERCSGRDARVAIGYGTALELKREPGPARSEWGIFYRYVWHREQQKAG